MNYMILVDYKSDAERKRIDYTIERWRDRNKGFLNKPRGTLLEYTGENIDELLDDLYSRVGGRDNVQVFEVGSYSPKIVESSKTLEYTTNLSKEFILGFIDIFMIKKLSASKDGEYAGVKQYMAYTKKGQGDIAIKIASDGDNTTKIVFQIQGYGDVVDLISKKIETDFRIYID